jgi:DNA-binding CsgD family transcriptional regulator
MRTATLDATIGDVRRCLEGAGLSLLVAALEGPRPSPGAGGSQVLVFTTSGDVEMARAAIRAVGLGHLLSHDGPPSVRMPSAGIPAGGIPAGGIPAGGIPAAPVLDLSGAITRPDAPWMPSGPPPVEDRSDGVPSSDLPPSSGLDLSAREVEVLRLFANGALHHQVARELYVSPKTVKNHLSHIYAKLGVANRTQAVALAVRHGIVSIG